jgi:hypothetical protein
LYRVAAVLGRAAGEQVGEEVLEVGFGGVLEAA